MVQCESFGEAAVTCPTFLVRTIRGKRLNGPSHVSEIMRRIRSGLNGRNRRLSPQAVAHQTLAIDRCTTAPGGFDGPLRVGSSQSSRPRRTAARVFERSSPTTALTTVHGRISTLWGRKNARPGNRADGRRTAHDSIAAWAQGANSMEPWNPARGQGWPLGCCRFSGHRRTRRCGG